MPAIETQSGNPANGRGRRDPTTAAEQNDQIVLCLRSYVGNEKDHRFECGPGFTHSLIVDGTARGSLTGDVDYRQLSKKYSTSSLFRKVYPRIEILMRTTDSSLSRSGILQSHCPTGSVWKQIYTYMLRAELTIQMLLRSWCSFSIRTRFRRPIVAVATNTGNTSLRRVCAASWNLI